MILRLIRIPSKTDTHDVQHLAWFRRRPTELNFVIGDTGLNIHRFGSISVTNVPRNGGTSLSWGKRKRRMEEIDQEPPISPDEELNTTVRTFGPFMLRVGWYF